jgi:hypothetical protein
MYEVAMPFSILEKVRKKKKRGEGKSESEDDGLEFTEKGKREDEGLEFY